ncbi:hypothetical protein HJFPF1_09746 [Paramyrothecium foliicola]|nr:hypothetical protein HJFPF1_09746 [Paramyrothecium foliicola]
MASQHWASEVPNPQVKGSDSISLDPLAVLAILWNPRASASASKLYAQPASKQYRWPHMMQIGAVTVAVSVLVSHLTMNYRSIHPAVEMFLGDVDKLHVKSTIGRAINLFTTLPLSGSESALIDSLNFRSSIHPANDIMVVSIGASGDGNTNVSTNVSTKQNPEQEQLAPKHDRFFAKTIFLVTEIIMGLLLGGGTVYSIYESDVWAMALFGSYLLHWLASTAVSFCHMVVTDPNMRIREDDHLVYAIYERQSGGLIVFRGTQDVMERWARTTWTFVDTTWHRCVHWAWMISGLAAALTSIANMVNMLGYLQLCFLGMLLYGSVAEVWLTIASRNMQSRSTSFLGPVSTHGVYANDKKFKSIVQSGLGIDNKHLLGTLKWTELGLLPSRSPFTTLEDVIEKLHDAKLADNERSAALESALEYYDENCKHLPQADQGTVAGIREEIKRAWLDSDN